MISKFETEYCTLHGIPLPQTSAEERMRLMCAFRPGHHLFNATCAKTGKRLLSSLPADKGLTIYDVDAWLGGDWDPRSYGREYDFSRPFFDQFADLLHAVPLPSLSGTHASLENCPYCNFITACKNCYLVFSGQHLEDCLYGRFLYHSRDIVDSFYVRHSELCYGCIDIQFSYNLHFSQHCQSCSDSEFLSCCRGCKNCFECANLSKKQFCWSNQQLTEKEWRRRRAAVDLGDAAVLARCKQSFLEFTASQPVRCTQSYRAENSSGNFLNQVADCAECFLVSESESLEHCIWVNRAKSCVMTIGFGGDSELLYNSTGVGNRAYNLKFCLQCRESVRDLEYCMLVEANSHDCFGCISVRNGSYCILNRQYTPEDYAALIPRIKEHMRGTGEYGKFFPLQLSPYGYNESDAALFFPLLREEALDRGFSWSDSAAQAATKGNAVLPDRIAAAGDEILQQNFECRATGKGYKILRKELDFLRAARIALPEFSPFERIRQAGLFLQWRPTRAVNCESCAGQCRTVNDVQSRTYCERCYQKLLVEGGDELP